jgi:signal transduction histidine kinase
LTGEELLQLSSLLVVCLLLVALGSRIAVEIRDSAQLFLILGWMSLGVLVLAALGGWYTAVFDTVDTGFETALVFLSLLAAGALFGAIVGYYDSRVRRLVERASREEARREFVDEQRETLSSLNGILRHQILNDLSAISGRAELIEAGKIEPKDATGSILEHCEHVDETVERIETVVDVLTHVSDVTDVNLDRAVQRAVTRAQENYPDLTVDTDGTSGVTVRADELLSVAIVELLENVAVHTDDAEATVSVRETIDTAVVEVSDEGPGTDVSADALFEPNTRGAESDGDGLGLFLATLIVERYDGSIRLAESDDGTTVAIEIPTHRTVPVAEPT